MSVVSMSRFPFSKQFISFFLLLGFLGSAPAFALELGWGARSTGHTFEISQTMSESFNARLAISGIYFEAKEEMASSEDVGLPDNLFADQWSYEGRQLSALIDYHPWQGNFRITSGATNNRMIFKHVNTGKNGFKINGEKFTEADIESISYKVQLTDGLSPYFGLGWASGFDKKKGWSFNGDLGYFFTAHYKVSLTVNCTKYSSTASCKSAKKNARKKEKSLQENALVSVGFFGLGLSYKF